MTKKHKNKATESEAKNESEKAVAVKYEDGSIAGWKVFGLCLIGSILLILGFAPLGIWPVAYVALVPWFWGAAKARSTRTALLASFFSGLVFWSVSVFWLIMPTPVGYIGGVIYLSSYWILAGYIMRRLGRSKKPTWIFLPFAWVAIEFARAHVVSFAWFFMAQTQYRLLPLLQIADITGQYGVSFFVVMINGLIVDAIFKRPRRGLITGAITAAVLLAGMVGYGYWRMNQNAQAPGPRVGIVQEAIPINLGGKGYTSWEIMKKHLEGTAELAGEKCDVILWPETMLPNGMNEETLQARVEEFTDDQTRSISSFIWSAGVTRRYEPDMLRRYLRLGIGPYDDAACESAGVRYVLNNFITPDILEKLSQAQIDKLCLQLLGKAKYEKLNPKARKTALAVFVPGVNVEPYDKKMLAELLTLYTNRPLDDGLDKYTFFMACRLKVATPKLGMQGREHEILKVQAGMMRAMSTIAGCPIFAGGATGKANLEEIIDNDHWLQSNSVVSFGGEKEQIYSKIHLVPFSEYVIFKDSCLPLYNFFRMFVPDVMPQIEPGKQYTRFDISSQSGQGRWQMVTPICFEGTFGRICKDMVGSKGKSSLIMANFSNDGWFTLPQSDNSHTKSTEHYQHLVHYIFRAIENRVPVVRAVNTGVSASISSNGEISYNSSNSPGKPGSRLISTAKAVNTLVDSRNTLYSLYGDIFAKLICIVCGLYILGKILSVSLLKKGSLSKNEKQAT